MLCGVACASAPEAADDDAERMTTLAPDLQHPDAGRRVATVRALSVAGAHAAPTLAAGLAAESDPAVQHAYVRALADQGGPDAIDALRATAAGRDAMGLRLAAVSGLTRIGAPAAVVLTELARASSPVGRAARLGLGVVGGAPALEFFRTALDRLRLPREDRRDVAAGLARLATAEDQARLRTLMADRDATVRRVAVAALGRVGTDADVSSLEWLARSDPDARVRRAAGIAVWRLRHP